MTAMYRELRHSEKGFTLVEILVAMAMLLAIMGGLYGSYQAVMLSVNVVGSQSRTKFSAAFFLEQLEKQLRCNVQPVSRQIVSSTNDMSVPRLDTPAEPCEPIFVGASSDDQEGFLRFLTTWRPRRQDQPLGGYTDIRYRWDPLQQQILVQLRPYTPRRRIIEQEDPPWSPVLTRVVEVFCEYFDGNEWQDVWPRNAGSLEVPLAVRIRVAILDASDEPLIQGLTMVANNQPYAAKPELATKLRDTSPRTSNERAETR